MRKINVYRCPICRKPYKTLTGWAAHMNLEHPENRPEGFSDSRYFYFALTGRTSGKCVTCGGETEWNEVTQKYNRFCNNPKCKEKYKEVFNKRMINKYGRTTLCDDPEQQRKMLKARKISGSYKFADGGSIDYVGSYEKDFLKLLDVFFHFKSSDIMGPSPHTYCYKYENQDHFYIPDFFIPDLNLEIEIKDETNHHHKIVAVDRVKEKLKDDVMNSIEAINYFKVTDKDYRPFFAYLMKLKESIPEADLKADPNAKYDLANEATRAFYESHPTMESAMNAFYGTSNTTEAAEESMQDLIPLDETDSRLEVANEITNAYLPSILDPISGEAGDDTQDYDVETHTEMATADPETPPVPPKDDKRIEAEKMIRKFSMVSPKFRKQKAQEIYEFIMNNNIDIDLSKNKMIAPILSSPITTQKSDPSHFGNSNSAFEGYVLSTNEKIPLKYTQNFALESSSANYRPRDYQPVYIVCMHSGTALANIIQKWTHDEFSHVALSFEPDLDPMYTFGRKSAGGGGFSIENPNMKFFRDRPNMPWAIYVTFASPNEIAMMKEKVMYFIRRESVFTYDFVGLTKIAFNKKYENPTSFFCSGFVADVLQSGNQINDRSYSLYKPQDLADRFASYEVARGNGFQNIDVNEVKKNTVKMKKLYLQKMKDNNPI